MCAAEENAGAVGGGLHGGPRGGRRQHGRLQANHPGGNVRSCASVVHDEPRECDLGVKESVFFLARATALYLVFFVYL